MDDNSRFQSIYQEIFNKHQRFQNEPNGYSSKERIYRKSPTPDSMINEPAGIKTSYGIGTNKDYMIENINRRRDPKYQPLSLQELEER